MHHQIEEHRDTSREEYSALHFDMEESKQL